MLKLRRLGLLVLLILTVLFVALAFVVALINYLSSQRIVHREPNFPCGESFHSDTSRYIYRRHFLTWTPDGTQLLFNHGRKYIHIVDAAGSRLRLVVTIGRFNYPSYGIHAHVSPDGTRLAYSSCEFATGTEYRYSEQQLYHYEIAIMNLDGASKRRLTENFGLDHYPVWSPDGKQIAFLSTLHRMSSDRHYLPANIQLYAMAADGSEVRRMAKPEHRGAAPLPPEWSPDGRYLAYLEMELPGKGEDYDRKKTVLYTVRVADLELTAIGISTLVPPAWSPDGRFLAFVKTDDPRGIYTARPDGTDLQQVMKLNRRTIHVSWSPDGAAFYVITDDLELHVIAADGRGLRQVSLGTSLRGTGEKLVAWSPDGRRIAIYFPSYRESGTYVGPLLFTVARDGSDRRDLIRGDNNYNPMPANSPPWDDT